MLRSRFLLIAVPGCRCFLILLIFLIFFSGEIAAQQSWTKDYPHLGTFSSPRLTDLNGDGIKDIIVGAGRLEFEQSDSAVLALDGNTGNIIWKKHCNDQIFGSAALKDINGDNVEDVFIGGRSAELIAVDGKSGKTIWQFNKQKYKSPGRNWFSFYNPQFIPDQNNDGMEDILVSNGGDVMAAPYNPMRPAGKLVVIDPLNGNIITEALMPDGKETYMSVSVLRGETNKSSKIIFGTGGETVGGSLFIATLDDVMKGNLSASIKLASSADRGFIAPAVWADINADSVPDIIANAVDGRMLAFSGKNYQPLWTMEVAGTEVYSSLCIGHFTKDSIPDFFVSYAKGKWPNLEQTSQYLVNGANGKIEFADSVGYYQTSTPVAIDLNDDGQDEAILSINFQSLDSNGLKTFFNTLMVFAFGAVEEIQLNDGLPGHNIASTPWIGDMDNDNKLDIVTCTSNNKYKTYSFDGLTVTRFKTDIPIKRKIIWGSYMGSSYDGIYHHDTN